MWDGCEGGSMKKGMKGVELSEYYCPHCQMFINLRKAIEKVSQVNRSGDIFCPYCKKKVATLS